MAMGMSDQNPAHSVTNEAVAEQAREAMSGKKFRELCQQKSEHAANILIEIAESEKAPAAARVQAANHILNRAYGMPTQHIDNEPPMTVQPIIIDLNAKQAGEVGDIIGSLTIRTSMVNEEKPPLPTSDADLDP